MRKNTSYTEIRTHVPTYQKVTTLSTELPGRPARITIDLTKTRKELTTVVIVPVVYIYYPHFVTCGGFKTGRFYGGVPSFSGNGTDEERG